MASLIRAPEEIYLSEKEWFGNTPVEQVKKEDSMEVDVSSSSGSTQPGASKFGSIEQLNRVFAYVANAMIDLDKQRRSSLFEDGMKVDKAGVTLQEDTVLRNLRLNLLALAKRAPLDTLALLPRDLIPEQIRHVIPTLTTSTPT
jgi:bromodomain-containing protein 7/9